MPLDWAMFFKIALLVFLFIGIVLGAYYVTKWISMAQFQKNQGKNIKVIESIGIGPQKILQLVQVGTQVFLIGITKDHITFMTEIDPSTIATSNIEAGQHASFQSYLSQWIQKGSQKKDQE